MIFTWVLVKLIMGCSGDLLLELGCTQLSKIILFLTMKFIVYCPELFGKRKIPKFQRDG